MNAQRWSPSDILDDGRIGILTESGHIVAGWGCGLNWEAAKKICEAHNQEIGKP